MYSIEVIAAIPRCDIFMGLFDGTIYKIAEQGLDVSWYQQRVISNNIANVDTPHFKAKTVHFGLVLDEVIHSRIQDKDTDRLSVRMNETYETNTNQILDGNNVDIEKENSALLDAQYQYSTMIDYLNSRYAMIRTAIGK